MNQSTRTKPPLRLNSAPDQKDEDSLPPYPILDAILHAHIEEGLDAKAIAEKGHSRDLVVEVLMRLERSEHKRWQMSPAPRVSNRAFGQGLAQTSLLHGTIGVINLRMNQKDNAFPQSMQESVSNIAEVSIRRTSRPGRVTRTLPFTMSKNRD